MNKAQQALLDPDRWFVVYAEPTEDGIMQRKVVVTKAVKNMRDAGITKNYRYSDDWIALADYISVHWGCLKKEK